MHLHRSRSGVGDSTYWRWFGIRALSKAVGKGGGGGGSRAGVCFLGVCLPDQSRRG